jgi:phage host-nuclease inhibitor protein Gam
MSKERIKADVNLTVMGCDNLEKADSLLRTIGDLQLQIHDEEAICKSSVDTATMALQVAVKPLQERIGLYSQALEQFAVANRKDVFGDKKSVKLQHGQMGWRQSAKTTIGESTIKLIKRFFKERVADLIEVKETVRKKALAKLTEAERIKVEVFTTVNNPFFVESNIPEAVDYAAQTRDD